MKMTMRKGLALAGLIAVAALAGMKARSVHAAAAAPFQVNAAWDVKQNLDQAFAAKFMVELQLRGGQTLAGLIAEVGDHAVHLTKLSGRDFFEAWVRLDDVSALVVRSTSR